MQSFGEYAADLLVSAYPSLAASRATLSSAATVYLARFDSLLSSDFVRESHARAARCFADAAAIPCDKARAETGRLLAQASRDYFAETWADVDAVVAANMPALQEARRVHARRMDIVRNGLGPNDNAVRSVDGVALEFLLADATPARPLVLKVYADYCSSCAAMAPEFEAAARAAFSHATFAAIDGPHNISATKDILHVNSYPTVLKFRGPGSKPLKLKRLKYSDILSFSASEDEQAKELQLPELTNIMSSIASSDVPVSPAGTPRSGMSAAEDDSSAYEGDLSGGLTGQWARMLRRQGIDQLDALVHDRDVAIHSKIDDALGCSDKESCTVPPAFTKDSGAEPVAVLLGGGMGSGKSASMHALSETLFWKERGSSVVVVEADAFKHMDPLFTALNAIGEQSAARIVHGKSLEGAEELFLKATVDRRDVVFDGTMAWKPFVDQTVAMLRDNKHYYRRGSGYKVGADGSVTEEYWVKGARRPFPVRAYRIEVVGVTVDAETAVERGIIRKLLTERGVPIAQQLESHKRFSEHFEEYARMVDSIYLFDNCVADGDCEEPAGKDGRLGEGWHAIIAAKRGILFPGNDSERRTAGLCIRDEDAYARFLRKAEINVAARHARELHALTPIAD